MPPILLGPVREKHHVLVELRLADVINDRLQDDAPSDHSRDIVDAVENLGGVFKFVGINHSRLAPMKDAASQPRRYGRAAHLQPRGGVADCRTCALIAHQNERQTRTRLACSSSAGSLACAVVERAFDQDDANLTFGAFLVRLRELIGARVEVVFATLEGDQIAALGGTLDADTDLDVEQHAMRGSFVVPVRPGAAGDATSPLWLFVDQARYGGAMDDGAGLRVRFGQTQVILQPDS